MQLSDCAVLARLYFEKYGLLKENFTFDFNQNTASFGLCRGKDGKITIELSAKLVLLNSEEEVEDTILHEIAHALDYIRSGYKWRDATAHDYVWRRICIEVGANPVACYTNKQVNVPSSKEQVNYALYHVPTKKVVCHYKRIPRIAVQTVRPKWGNRFNECIFVRAFEEEGTVIVCPNRIFENENTLKHMIRYKEPPILRPISVRQATTEPAHSV